MATLEDLKRDCQQLLLNVKGLQAIVITDKEGVQLFKVSSDLAPDFATKPQFLSTNAITSEQAAKLVGKCSVITCFYDNNQVVHFLRYPLMVSLIASQEANVGMLRDLESEFDLLFNSELRKVPETG